MDESYIYILHVFNPSNTECSLLHNLSLERKPVWICGVISYHIQPDHAHFPTHFPVQSHAHKLLMPFVHVPPTELLISRSKCSYFYSWSQVSLLLQFSWSEEEWLGISFPETVKHVSKNTCVCKPFCFLLVVLYCQSSDQTFIAADTVVHLNCQRSAYMFKVSKNRNCLQNCKHAWHGVACWEVIECHTKSPYHFSFQRYLHETCF